MAIKQFAIPLDENSDESGDITFKELADAGASAVFELTNVTASATVNVLDLITKKGGSTKDHTFAVSVSGGKASVTLSTSDLSAVYSDAEGGTCGYVEAKWTVGSVDTPDKSNQYMIQSGRTYDVTKWPPDSPCS